MVASYISAISQKWSKKRKRDERKSFCCTVRYHQCMGNYITRRTHLTWLQSNTTTHNYNQHRYDDTHTLTIGSCFCSSITWTALSSCLTSQMLIWFSTYDATWFSQLRSLQRPNTAFVCVVSAYLVGLAVDNHMTIINMSRSHLLNFDQMS